HYSIILLCCYCIIPLFYGIMNAMRMYQFPTYAIMLCRLGKINAQGYRKATKHWGMVYENTFLPD
ncbi:MAG: hypothetical protein P1S60_13895, partial [Anaerolineae bacterium]|nr:hypothetical protein [Anaerolineae bacterium]